MYQACLLTPLLAQVWQSRDSAGKTRMFAFSTIGTVKGWHNRVVKNLTVDLDVVKDKSCQEEESDRWSLSSSWVRESDRWSLSSSWVRVSGLEVRSIGSSSGFDC